MTTMPTIEETIAQAPAGTSGLVIEPWSKGEIYGVAANWGDAAAPVYIYGGMNGGWFAAGRHVADYSHSPRAALIQSLGDTLAAGGDDLVEADELVDGAVSF